MVQIPDRQQTAFPRYTFHSRENNPFIDKILQTELLNSHTLKSIKPGYFANRGHLPVYIGTFLYDNFYCISLRAVSYKAMLLATTILSRLCYHITITVEPNALRTL